MNPKTVRPAAQGTAGFPVDSLHAGITVPSEPAAHRQLRPHITGAMNHIGVGRILIKGAIDGFGRCFHGLLETRLGRLNNRLIAGLGNGRQNIPDIRPPVHWVGWGDARRATSGKGAGADRRAAIFIGIHFPSQRQLFLIAQAHCLGGLLLGSGKSWK